MFAQAHQRVKPICDSVVRLNLRRDLRMFAESREKYRRDMEAIKDYARDEGHAEGHSVGHAKGRAEGYEAAKAEADEIIKAKDAALSEQATALQAALAEIERLKAERQ